MDRIILQKGTQKCIVVNPKKIKFWTTLIDGGSLKYCSYKKAPYKK